MDETRVPILVGCSQITQREEDPAKALSPMDLTEAAARQAAADTGAGKALLGALDTVLVVRSFADTSWRFGAPFGQSSNPPRTLVERLGASGAERQIYTFPGGNMVQWSINRMFEMITRGELGAALIAGGEALSTQKAAQRAGLELDWNEEPGGQPEMWGVETRGWNDVEDRHRMAGAIFAYPMFENALRHHKGRTVAEHGAKLGQLFARFAAVAAANPLADRRDGFSAEQIATVGPDNPYIGFPYTKLMNANAFIDQSAALILTSVAKAKALGIPQDKWVYLHGCSDTYDHWYISDRKDFYSSPAMRVAGEEALAMADCGLDDMGAFDIYSCFPSAVQLACQELGLALDDPRGLTVTGGLPYFGGPGNNYVTHSIAEMMNRVRAKPGMKGLVTSCGNYVTKEAVGIYSTDAPDRAFAPKDPSVYQAALNADKGRTSIEAASGAAEIETYTVMHDRAGPSYAIIMAILEDGRRCIANTAEDPELLADMVANDYMGAQGSVSHGDGLNIFTPRIAS
jgi:acetyl-CoA C-acetyltransferase